MTDKRLLSVIREALGEGSLYSQPDKYDENQEAANRKQLAQHFFYADLEVGDPNGFDKKGNYICGDCNWIEGSSCLLVKGRIDSTAGSCQHWESITTPPIKMQYLDTTTGNYGVAKNGEGFGCKRCSFAINASEADSKGRSLFCRKGNCRVFENACCGLNDVPCK